MLLRRPSALAPQDDKPIRLTFSDGVMVSGVDIVDWGKDGMDKDYIGADLCVASVKALCRRLASEPAIPRVESNESRHGDEAKAGCVWGR